MASPSSSSKSKEGDGTGEKKQEGSAAPASDKALFAVPISASSKRVPTKKRSILEGCEVFINPSLDVTFQEVYRQLVREHGGGVQYYFEPSTTTHVITADLAHFAELEAACEANIHLVTPLWLENSILFQEREDEEFYSPDPNKFFSGLCICSANIREKDRDLLLAGVVAFGGRISVRLNSRCTHLIMPTPASGAKLKWALKHRIKVVNPCWYNDSITFQRREDEDKYSVLGDKPKPSSSIQEAAHKRKKKSGEEPAEERKTKEAKTKANQDVKKGVKVRSSGVDSPKLQSQAKKKEEEEEEKNMEPQQAGTGNSVSAKDNELDLLSQFELADVEKDAHDEGEGTKFRLPPVGDEADEMPEDENDMATDERLSSTAKQSTKEATKPSAVTKSSSTVTPNEGERGKAAVDEGDAPDSEAKETGKEADKIKAYIRENAHRVNARELRIKFHMDHPRAKRLLKEVIAEMGKEVTGPSKKSTDVLPAGKERKRTEREQKDATKAKAKKRKRTKKAKTKPNKEAAQKEHPTTTTTSSSSKPAESMKKSASTEEKGGAVKQSQLMKGVGILLMDLTEESYRDAVEAVREMGGTTYRGVPAEGTIEGIPWNKDALSVITHVLYPSPTRAIRELIEKLALHGVTNLPEVSLDWIQWCDIYGKRFPPSASPLFQILPTYPIPDMSDLVISQSNTRGWEREEIVTLTVKAGATYNRSMPNGPNVVLIVVPPEKGSPSSEKVQMAKEWGVPIVSKEWLYACAREWRRLNPSDYLIPTAYEDDEKADKNNNEGKQLANQEGKKELKKLKIAKAKSERKEREEVSKRTMDIELDDEDVDIMGDLDENGEGEEEDDKPSGRKALRGSRGGVGDLANRCCSQCKATKTPCWRKGPEGDRTLCNACGLKFSAEMRRRHHNHDTRKRKRSREELDLDTADLDQDDKRAMRTSFSMSKKQHRNPLGDDDDNDEDEGDFISEDEHYAGDNFDEVQHKVHNLMATHERERPHFAFSCVTKSTAAKLKRIVTKLGGTYSEHWESGVTTHLILGTLRRTEKLLCACASGSWVLHSSYLIESDTEGRFLDEEPHEWYAEEWDDENEKRIWVACMRRHRLRQLETGKRTFEGWEFYIMGETEPEPEILSKIIEAGGGRVLSLRAFSKLKKPKENRYGLVGTDANLKSIKRMMEIGIPCLESIYVATYLCARKKPQMEGFQI